MNTSAQAAEIPVLDFGDDVPQCLVAQRIHASALGLAAVRLGDRSKLDFRARGAQFCAFDFGYIGLGKPKQLFLTEAAEPCAGTGARLRRFQ